MKYFSVLSSLKLFTILFALTIFTQVSFFYNSLSYILNMIGIAVICLVLFFFGIPYYMTNPALVRNFYLFATIAIINFTFSFLGNLNESISKPPTLPKDDWSELIIAPITFIVVVIWGLIFDWKKNKITQSFSGNE